MNKLLNHFKRMQAMATTYLEPAADYTTLAGEIYEAPDLAQNNGFIDDTIYMLDGPEQREAQAEAEFDFIAEANLTLSPAFHGHKVPLDLFIKACQDYIAAGNRLDRMKKALFYGRDYIHNDVRPHVSAPGPDNEMDIFIQRIAQAGGQPVYNEDDAIRVWKETEILLHGIVGKATESAELVEALLKAYLDGKPLDRVNLIEEIGDGSWYDAIMLKVLGQSFYQVWVRITKKLRARFPNNFSEYDANNRNLTAEREILEAKNQLGSYAQVIDGEGKSELKPISTDKMLMLSEKDEVVGIKTEGKS